MAIEESKKFLHTLTRHSTLPNLGDYFQQFCVHLPRTLFFAHEPITFFYFLSLKNEFVFLNQ